MQKRWTLVSVLGAWLLCACAGSGDEGQSAQPSLRAHRDAESAAKHILPDTLRFNSAVQAAVLRVRDADDLEERTLFDEIRVELQQLTAAGETILSWVADETLELTLNADEDTLAANVHARIWRFAELFTFPMESIPRERVGTLWFDTVDLTSELAASFKYGRDDTKRAKTAYYFAPAYNVLTSLQVIAAAASNRTLSDSSYRMATETNRLLVGNGEGDDLGMLSEWVAAETPGSASTRAKLDKDPIIYSIRRSLQEQQHALER